MPSASDGQSLGPWSITDLAEYCVGRASTHLHNGIIVRAEAWSTPEFDGLVVHVHC